MADSRSGRPQSAIAVFADWAGFAEAALSALGTLLGSWVYIHALSPLVWETGGSSVQNPSAENGSPA